MGNCLFTKLKEVANNDELSVLGELRMKINGALTAEIMASPANQIIVRLNGTRKYQNEWGYITQAFAAGDILTYNPKYDLTSFSIVGNIVGDNNLAGIDVGLLNFVGNNTDDPIQQTTINALKTVSSIRRLNVAQHRCDGIDFNFLAEIPVKEIIAAYSTTIFDYVLFGNKNPRLQSITDCQATGRSVTNWPENNRPSEYPIISIQPIDNISVFWSGSAITNFINNMANCQVPEDGTKIMSFNSTSNVGDITAAVTTLKGYGYTIKINGVEQ